MLAFSKNVVNPLDKNAFGARDIDCKNPPITEADMINELVELIDKIDLDELGVKSKVEQEMLRINKFKAIVGEKSRKSDIEVSSRDYAKYLLKEGALIEKRELLYFMKSKLILKNRKISLE